MSVHAAKRRRALVICDARWDATSRCASIAVTGALGTHTRTIPADTSTIAEAHAVLFAQDIALAHGGLPQPLVFRTDCQSLVTAKRTRGGEQRRLLETIRRRLARYRQWELEFARRQHTGAAHTAAANEWAHYGEPALPERAR